MGTSRRAITLSLAAIFVLGLSSAAHAIPLIDTTPSWIGEGILPFGETDTATYGQTFTVTGTETQLNSFTFFIDDHVNPDVVDFQAFVYAWTGTMITGPALFASGAMSTTNNGGAGGWETITINTGGTNLISGNQYVAFLSASNLFDGSFGTSTWQFISSSAYAGGDFVFMNNGNNFGQLFTSGWAVTGGDASFIMRFTDPIPEPATMTLMGLGLVGLALRRRMMKA